MDPTATEEEYDKFFNRIFYEKEKARRPAKKK
jgi:hypothetical protein